jgi:hypothetical protein
MSMPANTLRIHVRRRMRYPLCFAEIPAACLFDVRTTELSHDPYQESMSLRCDNNDKKSKSLSTRCG